jgi:hypothetical protein
MPAGIALFGGLLVGLSGGAARGDGLAVPGSLTVALASGSALGDPADGITTSETVQVVGQTAPAARVVVLGRGNEPSASSVLANSRGRFSFRIGVSVGANLLRFSTLPVKPATAQASLLVVRWPKPAVRPFDGSPTAGGQPFGRLIPNSQAYNPGLPPRLPVAMISQNMLELNPAFSPNIVLGLVFFGQFVDHDVTLNDTTAGQGPSVNPVAPIDLRTPALDLDSVYGKGPQGQPGFYTSDGLCFALGTGGTDLLRDANGVAIIGDPRNDENGQIASIHRAFQQYHNTLVSTLLRGNSPASLGVRQKQAVFAMARNLVIGFHQGLVANEMAVAFTGRPVADGMPPVDRIPVEFAVGVYRLGHTLVPNQIVVNESGKLVNPTDPSLRGPGASIPYTLLFGPTAQPAAKFDHLLSNTMHTLLIPLSPTDAAEGDLIGGDSPNIGQGHLDSNNVMHLDLAETNVLRGREQRIPSGEEYLAMLRRVPYHPARDGNTDMFPYILHEADLLGHLGLVGGDVFHRTIGGILAADPYRYTNPDVYTPEQIMLFKNATFEMLLHLIGAPGF